LAVAVAASPPGSNREHGARPSPPALGCPLATAEAAPVPAATSYASLAEALRAVLAGQPRVLAVGELHQTKATARVPSALARFTREMLAPLREAGATDLVVETWITTGACGEVEEKAVAQVEKTTERPARTENEVLTLLKQAKQAGILPRILQVACQDYRAMMGGSQIDFDRVLRLTRDQLEAQIRAALARPGSRMVVSYGGALHNDLQPTQELGPYSFGPAVSSLVGGRYVELDLYVPEYVDQNAALRKEPWWGAYRGAYRRGQVTLVRRGDSSYALIFPRAR